MNIWWIIGFIIGAIVGNIVGDKFYEWRKSRKRDRENQPYIATIRNPDGTEEEREVIER